MSPIALDVSAVIDRSDANTAAETSKVASVGISYGAGSSLLASARDPRIAVVGALSGWADLIASINPNETVSLQAVAGLLALGNITGRPGPEMQALQTKFLTGDFAGAVADAKQLAPVRSAATVVDAINVNRPAVFLANAFEDSIFPPGQYSDFFTRLGWLDHDLTGADNGADQESSVQLKSQRGGWRGYPSWAVVGTDRTSNLTKPSGLSWTGGLAGSGATGWSYGIGTGVPTIADSGVALVPGAPQGCCRSRPASSRRWWTAASPVSGPGRRTAKPPRSAAHHACTRR